MTGTFSQSPPALCRGTVASKGIQRAANSPHELQKFLQGELPGGSSASLLLAVISTWSLGSPKAGLGSAGVLSPPQLPGEQSQLSSAGVEMFPGEQQQQQKGISHK